MDKVFLCPCCNNVLIKSLGTEFKIRGKILVIKSEQVVTVCKECNKEVSLPLSVNTSDLAKSLISVPLFIKNR